MRVLLSLLGLVVAAGGASATHEGGYVSTGNGLDLSPLVGGCFCYGVGTVYHVGDDGEGSLWFYQDQGMNAGQYPSAPGAGPLLSVHGARWMQGWANPEDGRAEMRMDGGFGAVARSAGAEHFLGQDAMVRLDKERGAHAEFHDSLGGTHASQHVGLCVDVPGSPGAGGADLFTHLNGIAPFPNGVGPGDCRFET